MKLHKLATVLAFGLCDLPACAAEDRRVQRSTAQGDRHEQHHPGA